MPRPPSPCGTFAAYRRHLKKGEPVDEACQQAARDEQSARREKKRDAARVHVDADAPAEVLDELGELLAMYRVLKQHMLEAPPQSIAAIVRQADATLTRIKELEGADEKKSGGLLDGDFAPSAVPANVVRFPGAHVAGG